MIKKFVRYGLVAISLFVFLGCSGCGSKRLPHLLPKPKADILYAAIMDYRRDMGMDAFLALNQDKNLIQILSSPAKDKNGQNVGPWLLDRDILNTSFVYILDVKTKNIFYLDVWNGEKEIIFVTDFSEQRSQQ